MAGRLTLSARTGGRHSKEGGTRIIPFQRDKIRGKNSERPALRRKGIIHIREERKLATEVILPKERRPSDRCNIGGWGGGVGGCGEESLFTEWIEKRKKGGGGKREDLSPQNGKSKGERKRGFNPEKV